MKKRFLPFMTLILLTSMSFAQNRVIQVTVPEETEVVYIAGVMNNWNTSSDTMTKISDSPKMYTFEFEMADTAGLKYKFLSGPDWKYQQTRTTDFVYTFDSVAVVDAFQAIYHKDQADSVTINVLVPGEVIELYLTGTFSGWTEGTNKMTEVDSTLDGKEFTLTVFVTDTTTLEYKFIAGPEWAYEQTVGDNYVYMVDGGTVECELFNAIYDPNALGDITLNITVPEGTAEVWVIGSFGGWNLENPIQATKNEDNTFTAVIPNVGTIQYKVYSFPHWDYEEAVDAEGNPVANRVASWASGPEFDITVAFWKQLYIPTGVNDRENVKNKAYVRNSSIVVDGVVEKVTVFDVQGRVIQDTRTKGTFTSRALRTGLYIIRVDGQTQKVVVR